MSPIDTTVQSVGLYIKHEKMQHDRLDRQLACLRLSFWPVCKKIKGNDRQDFRSLLFTALCYASAVLAMGLCPSVCVCHKSVW